MKTLDITKHRVALTNILLDLYKDSYISPKLGFKGGTSALFFYELPRFSVDLDFDYLGQAEEVEELAQRINKLLKKKYRIKDFSNKNNTLFWLVNYEENYTNVKIEISTRDYSYNTYKLLPFFGTKVSVLEITDMIAHKMVAATERNEIANRDIFDIYFFLSSKYASKINYNVIWKRTKKSPLEFYKFLLEYIKKIESKGLLNGLGEVLNNDQKLWVKENLLNELVGLMERQINLFPKFVKFTSNIQEIKVTGNYRQFDFEYLVDNQNFYFPIKISYTLINTDSSIIEKLKDLFQEKITQFLENNITDSFDTIVITSDLASINGIRIEDIVEYRVD